MNPVRSFAPDLVRGNLTHTWVYVVGPFLGALVAVLFAYILRGPGGDAEATRAAQGDQPRQQPSRPGSTENVR